MVTNILNAYTQDTCVRNQCERHGSNPYQAPTVTEIAKMRASVREWNAFSSAFAGRRPLVTEQESEWKTKNGKAKT
jgi:hypothetical protein